MFRSAPHGCPELVFRNILVGTSVPRVFLELFAPWNILEQVEKAGVFRSLPGRILDEAETGMFRRLVPAAISPVLRSRKVWKPIREKWRSVPAHIRKGLLRLYIAVSTLWVVWFGYQILVVPVRYISRLFWTLLFVPIGGPILFFIVLWIFEGFRKPQIEIGHLRDRIATDILFRPDVAAYEYLATGSYLGEKKLPRVRLDEKSLSAEQKAALPTEFYGPNGVDPNELAKYFGYQSGEAMLDHLVQLFAKWGYVDRNQMLNKIIDEELDRRRRKAASIRR